jgi:hypothetical protein
MFHKKSEKGQALVIIALAAVGLFAFTALAVDGSRVFSDRRHAQNAADTAALAAALAKIRTPDYPPNAPNAPDLAAIAAGEDRAESNGYITDADSNVQVHICDEAGLVPPCEGLPATADTPEEKAEFIQVVIRLSTKTTFARIIGWQEVRSIVTAVARAKTGSSIVQDGLAAISALTQTGIGIKMDGNIILDVINSGVFSNSNSNSTCPPPGGSIYSNGNNTLDVDTNYTVGSNSTSTGTFCMSSNTNVDPNDQTVAGPQIPYPPTNINPPVPSITCSPDPITITGNTINPGTLTSQFTIPSTYGNYTFATGNYCFENGANINGNINLTAQPDVKFRINGGGFTINGNTSLQCDGEMLIHSVTGPGVKILGNSITNCSSITFYMSSGTVYFSGTSSNTISAPTSGDYKGLLIYLPYLNTTPLRIEGNSNQHFTGSIIGVSSDITVAGNNTSFAVNSQFVGYTFTVSGNINFTVNYDPALQYLPPEGPSIEFTE